MNTAKTIVRKLISEFDQPHDGTEGFSSGDVVSNGNSSYVVVDGIARGGVTIFLTDTDGDGTYYIGENPEHSSDGMVIEQPWCFAEKLGGDEALDTFVHTGETNQAAADKAVESYGAPSFVDGNDSLEGEVSDED